MDYYIRKNSKRVKVITYYELCEVIKDILFGYYLKLVEDSNLPWKDSLNKFYWEYADIDYLDEGSAKTEGEFVFVREGSLVLSMFLGLDASEGYNVCQTPFPWEEGLEWLETAQIDRFGNKDLSMLHQYAINSIKLNIKKYDKATLSIDEVWVINTFVKPILRELRNGSGSITGISACELTGEELREGYESMGIDIEQLPEWLKNRINQN